MDWRRELLRCLSLYLWLRNIQLQLCIAYYIYVQSAHTSSRRPKTKYSMISRAPDQISHLRKLTELSDEDCISNLRMDRNTFARLCRVMECMGGLTEERNVQITEQVAIFLSILSHHKKTRVVGFDFNRSIDTISRYFHRCLDALVRCHENILVKPKPITDDCDNDTWSPFKGCLGALDGTLIDVQVPLLDQKRYRSRKGETVVNVLGVCDPNMQFIYVLAGWEGSAADSRVLRDAVMRPTGLRVPSGNYYLCDCGYMNADGFLAPYRGRRYHLKEWGAGAEAPRDKYEYFNMKHSKARNIIERAFGLLKGRWGILRSPSFYSVRTHNKIVICCALLHNFIRREMSSDPEEQRWNTIESDDEVDDTEIDLTATHINSIEASNEWTNKREQMATDMFDKWRRQRAYA